MSVFLTRFTSDCYQKSTPRIYLSPPDISLDDRAAIEKALDSGWVAPVGPQIDAFEAALSNRFKPEVHDLLFIREHLLCI